MFAKEPGTCRVSEVKFHEAHQLLLYIIVTLIMFPVVPLCYSLCCIPILLPVQYYILLLYYFFIAEIKNIQNSTEYRIST